MASVAARAVAEDFRHKQSGLRRRRRAGGHGRNAAFLGHLYTTCRAPRAVEKMRLIAPRKLRRSFETRQATRACGAAGQAPPPARSEAAFAARGATRWSSAGTPRARCHHPQGMERQNSYAPNEVTRRVQRGRAAPARDTQLSTGHDLKQKTKMFETGSDLVRLTHEQQNKNVKETAKALDPSPPGVYAKSKWAPR